MALVETQAPPDASLAATVGVISAGHMLQGPTAMPPPRIHAWSQLQDTADGHTYWHASATVGTESS
eukprot:3336458-Lingulodinium_polyedra.AAC.1